MLCIKKTRIQNELMVFFFFLTAPIQFKTVFKTLNITALLIHHLGTKIKITYYE